jgi:hypothetical protein
MPGPSSFDRKVYGAMEKTDYIPDQFKTWMPRYLRYLSALQVGKTQIPGVMGEQYRNVGDAGQPAFVSPWRHYSAGSSAFGKVRFYKDYTGIVHLEGVAETTGTPGSNLIFSLPAGYRPSQALVLVVRATTVVGQPADTARIDILAAGDVQVITPDYTKFTSGSGLSLSNIHFRAG